LRRPGRLRTAAWASRRAQSTSINYITDAGVLRVEHDIDVAQAIRGFKEVIDETGLVKAARDRQTKARHLAKAAGQPMLAEALRAALRQPIAGNRGLIVGAKKHSRRDAAESAIARRALQPAAEGKVLTRREIRVAYRARPGVLSDQPNRVRQRCARCARRPGERVGPGRRGNPTNASRRPSAEGVCDLASPIASAISGFDRRERHHGIGCAPKKRELLAAFPRGVAQKHECRFRALALDREPRWLGLPCVDFLLRRAGR